ncbi:hypothetical protein PFICI_01292 [Pestalotiopsis fici W106-1]|uniref:Uncharacterized protein n=1 Tax=Pestalotiopsis fici (strain W106-1 / CGMCC3.15140) TaxID=1229662 RepID=W3XN93_PESFW|nr:uncharacterized protein PFICI_01292 [Pestalotiopsis fici W106-1]ETS87464.1 hypothetical protein PFICI_01292 [Pestalotiopsis fici W106-1]
MNGAPGSDHHIPFPIAIRSSYGFYLGYSCVVSRGVLSIVWFAVNCWVGSFAVTETIAALWPEYKLIENQLPTNARITSLQMTSYLVFFLIQLPFFFIPMTRLRSVSVLFSISMVVWICAKAGDLQGIFNQPASVSGATRTWLWLSTFSATTNSWLSSAINMSDFARFSKTRYAPYSQIPTIPIIKTVYAVLGIATVGASRVLYGADIWSPVEILPLWTGSGGRFLAFLCGCLWILAQISCNISANAVPFGHDLMNVFPMWINVRRGTILCLLVGSWAVVPWMLVNSAAEFLQFMNGYGCVVCGIVSIMISDYWLVRRRKLDIPALYDPHARYRYFGGFNWRAATTQLCFMALSLPGLINQISPSATIPDGLLHLYELNWFINTLGPLLLYWMLWKFWPARETLVSKTISAVIIPSMGEDVGEGMGSSVGMRGKSEKQETTSHI